MNKLEKIKNLIKTQDVIVSGAGIGEQAFLVSQLNAPIFFVAVNEENAYKISQQLSSLGIENILLDGFDKQFLFSKYQSKDNQLKIIDGLHKIINNRVEVVVTTLNGLRQKICSKEVFVDNTLIFEVNKCYNLDNIIKKLVSMGYKRVDSVEQYGEFSLRGDLLDIFCANSEYPIRINFFDDEIETIIHFDSANLTKVDSLNSISVLPNTLCLFTKEETHKCENQFQTLFDKYKDNALLDIYESLKNLNCPLEFLQCMGLPTHNIFEYLKSPIIVYQNAFSLTSMIEQFDQEVYDRINSKFKNEELKKYIINSFIKSKINYEKIDLNKIKINNNYNFVNKNQFFSLFFENIETNYSINLFCKRLNNYIKNIALIKNDFSPYELMNKTIKLCLDNQFTYNSIKEILLHYNIPFSTNLNSKGIVLTQEKYPYNICIEDEDVWYVGSTNFAHKKVVKNNGTKAIKYLPKANEFVVHEVHGIGMCEGVVTLKIMGVEKDFFKIIYQKGDVLYVPTENTDSLSLYMGASEAKLNKLGGKEFEAIKKRTEHAVEEMAKDLLELYAKRAQSKGHKYPEDDYLMTEFENAFEFEETDDQAQAIIDIKKDMTAGKVMDRLICGDVGYGKTEVAMRAVFKTFLENKQVAVLAPTTILSLQHFMTFNKRFKDFGVRIEMLNRFKSAKEKSEIIKKLKDGKIDVVCGTHSLLAEGVDFKDLGLLVLDEEQRFGVKAKEKIKNLKNNVNVLTMSATPIPRTLNMAMLTLRDISIINTPPVNRLPVKTYICPFNLDLIAQAVESEIDRNGQVLIVYNDVERIYNLASDLKSKLNNEKFKFDVAHGKMTKLALENAIKRLYDGQTNVFVSTTLIENGVDLPKANTLIVLDSQNLGLSQMYQLRGRVGRSQQQAYAYFTYPQNKTLTIEASNRLEALAENTELGSGFKIAMRDLQLRGAGELLGREQHGHMMKVGYDLYLKLLEEAIKRLKGETGQMEVKEVKIDIAISARIPNDFVQEETEKLKIYSKISNIKSMVEQKNVLNQLKDTYGKLPKEVVQLTNVSLLKAFAQRQGVKHIIINKNNMAVVYYKENFDSNKILKSLINYQKFSLINGELPTIKLNSNDFSIDTAQAYIIEFLNEQNDLK